jgi:hypothetical protein
MKLPICRNAVYNIADFIKRVHSEIIESTKGAEWNDAITVIAMKRSE